MGAPPSRDCFNKDYINVWYRDILPVGLLPGFRASGTQTFYSLYIWLFAYKYLAFYNQLSFYRPTIYIFPTNFFAFFSNQLFACLILNNYFNQIVSFSLSIIYFFRSTIYISSINYYSTNYLPFSKQQFTFVLTNYLCFFLQKRLLTSFHSTIVRFTFFHQNIYLSNRILVQYFFQQTIAFFNQQLVFVPINYFIFINPAICLFPQCICLRILMSMLLHP